MLGVVYCVAPGSLRRPPPPLPPFKPIEFSEKKKMLEPIRASNFLPSNFLQFQSVGPFSYFLCCNKILISIVRQGVLVSLFLYQCSVLRIWHRLLVRSQITKIPSFPFLLLSWATHACDSLDCSTFQRLADVFGYSRSTLSRFPKAGFFVMHLYFLERWISARDVLPHDRM